MANLDKIKVGEITYDIADSTARNEKQDTLVSGENIKTINGESILGEGNITITGDGTAVDAYTKQETDWKLSEKQPVLVSGQNIKTVNGESILGSGDMQIRGIDNFVHNSEQDLDEVHLYEYWHENSEDVNSPITGRRHVRINPMSITTFSEELNKETGEYNQIDDENKLEWRSIATEQYVNKKVDYLHYNIATEKVTFIDHLGVQQTIYQTYFGESRTFGDDMEYTPVSVSGVILEQDINKYGTVVRLYEELAEDGVSYNQFVEYVIEGEVRRARIDSLVSIDTCHNIPRLKFE